MNEDALLVKEIQKSFATRRLPETILASKIFDPSVDREAFDVENFFRQKGFVVDRSNSCLVGFNYFDDEAAVAILPFYMISIIENFVHDDFLIDLILGALATGRPGGLFQARNNIGIGMRNLSSTEEASSVCRFINWLFKKVPEDGLRNTYTVALGIWCTQAN